MVQDRVDAEDQPNPAEPPAEGDTEHEMDTATVTQPLEITYEVEFLADWLGDAHRDLSDEARYKVGRYIHAIVERDPLLGERGEAARRDAEASLWRKFRTDYDGRRGPFMKSATEDVGRAMSRI
jgi:hypothetical protein